MRQKKPFSLMLLVSLALSNAVYADDNACTSQGNLICIAESNESVATNIEGEAEYTSRYQITNNSNSDIFLFAVLNTSGDINTESQISGWSAENVTQNIWDNTKRRYQVSNSFELITGAVSPFPDFWKAIGSFDSLFGNTNASNRAANVYYKAGTENPLNNGTSLDDFLFGGLPEASSFVAFDAAGELIAGGTTIVSSNVVTLPPTTTVSSVPEPSTYVMLLAGLGLIRLSQLRKTKTVI